MKKLTYGELADKLAARVDERLRRIAPEIENEIDEEIKTLDAENPSELEALKIFAKSRVRMALKHGLIRHFRLTQENHE